MFSHIKELFTRPSGYTISRSVRLRSSASAYFNRTQTSGNRRTYTYSAWVKRGNLTTKQNLFGSLTYVPASQNDQSYWSFLADNTFEIALYSGSAYLGQLITTQVFRDPSAWYHIVVQVDTTQATSSNRLKLYVNGTQITSFSTTNYPAQNTDTFINANGYGVGIGRVYSFAGSEYFDGYMTEINFIDGQALTPSSFGSTNAITGVWQPAKYTGTYGTNGFYLNFSDNSSNTATTIGKDYSGNGNNWTPNNISVTAGVTYDSMVDSPTTSAVSSNYAVLNPLNNVITLSDGNLKGTTASASWNPVISTFGVSSGKWYWEYTVTGNNDVFFGISPSTYTATSGQYPGSSSSNGYGYYGANGNKYNLGAGGATYGASVTTNDVVGVALDMDAGTLTFYKNNTSQGVAASSITGTWMPAMAVYNNNAVINFGQRPFTYTPPTGYVALNTWNLPDSTIKNGAAYMAATLYTGNGSTQSISNAVNGISFQPDLVWMKSRTSGGSAYTNHVVVDSVRGAGANGYKNLYPNLTDAELDPASGNASATALNSNGFTLGANANTNTNTMTAVAWQWKAGTTSASNTNGSITSTVSVGATQGFSVVTYTGNSTSGATVGHGLGVAPSMIIVKCRSGGTGGGVRDWPVYHASLDNTKYISLNLTSASATNSAYWNNTSPSSSVFTIGSGGDVNISSGNFVAYCFAAVAGYSAFGSYTGNGSSDGPFVYTGFRPRWVMMKCTNTTSQWVMYDTARDSYNTMQDVLFPNLSNAEENSVDNSLDIVSNGFKFRSGANRVNVNGNTFIYAAFAENPFKNSLAR